MAIFTEKETEIIELIARGLTSKEIAEVLHNTPKTIEYHISIMLQKIHGRNRLELAMYALSNEVIEFPNYGQSSASDYKIHLVKIKR